MISEEKIEEDEFEMSEDCSRTEPGGKAPWGLLSCIDLYDCDPKIIRDADAIKEFVAKLCHPI